MFYYTERSHQFVSSRSDSPKKSPLDFIQGGALDSGDILNSQKNWHILLVATATVTNYKKLKKQFDSILNFPDKF